jgi:hypothetical protein
MASPSSPRSARRSWGRGDVAFGIPAPVRLFDAADVSEHNGPERLRRRLTAGGERDVGAAGVHGAVTSPTTGTGSTRWTSDGVEA